MPQIFSIQKLKQNKIPIFLGLFLLLTLISIPTIYVVHQQNAWQEETTVVATYNNSADYSYIVHVLPNSIYQNRTVLLYNEVIYASVVEDIDLTLKYSFNSDVPSSFSVDYTLTQTLNTSTLEQRLLTTNPVTFNEPEFAVDIPSLNIKQIEDLKEQTEIERGSFSPYYSIILSPIFSITAETESGTIETTFNPKLIVSLENTDQGNIFTLEGLNQQEPGELSITKLYANRDILNQQLMSDFLLIISIIGLSISVFSYIKIPKPNNTDYPISKKKWQKLVDSYPNLFYATERISASDINKSKIVNIKSIEDLIRLAETADSPILYLGQIENRRFILIDRDTLYQYQNRKQTIVQAKNTIVKKLKSLFK